MSQQPAQAIRSAARPVLCAIAALCLAIAFLAPPAAAQERVERRSILEFLFGRQTPQLDNETPPRRPPPRPRRRAAVAAAPAAASADQPAPVEKLAAAQTILVVGDFLANGLGSGLEDAFAASPGVAIESHGNIASGLVRADYYDWQAQLPKMLDSTRPAAVVVMLGANDRQQLAAPGINEKFGTDTWFMAYEERVRSFARLVTDRHIALLWVGLPPFGSDDMTADVVKLNQLYQSQVESVGGSFVDLWGGFTDEDGKFLVTGSDVNGQQVRLRTADGINMTAAGRRKMAFYAEKPIRRLLGDQASPDLVRLDTDTAADPAALPHAETAAPNARTAPIGLSDPDLDGGSVLLGGAAPPSTTTPSPRDLLVEKGQMAPAPAGRVDDFRWPAAAPEKPQ